MGVTRFCASLDKGGGSLRRLAGNGSRPEARAHGAVFNFQLRLLPRPERTSRRVTPTRWRPRSPLASPCSPCLPSSWPTRSPRASPRRTATTRTPTPRWCVRASAAAPLRAIASVNDVHWDGARIDVCVCVCEHLTSSCVLCACELPPGRLHVASRRLLVHAITGGPAPPRRDPAGRTHSLLRRDKLLQFQRDARAVCVSRGAAPAIGRLRPRLVLGRGGVRDSADCQ